MKNSAMADSQKGTVCTSRRAFLKQSTTAVAGGLVTGLSIAHSAHLTGSGVIRVGLVGCGGRGTGAATQVLNADRGTRLVAISDAFADRLQVSLKSMKQQKDIADRVLVDSDHQFTGFDGYKHVIASDVDVVLLATPPHFRPMHLRACIEAGKHVFAEKPVAVDAPGVRSVLETTELAKRKDLFIVSGLNGRYSPALQEIVRRTQDGAVGEIVALHAARYGGGVWVRPREPGMTDMEYQMRNWYYFTWLSGDFNVEQFVHQIDRMAWIMSDRYPARCYSTGGRQSRTGPDHGHIYDHFSSVFEYPQGVRVFTTTRHQRGCTSESQAIVMGTKGVIDLNAGTITGANPWKAPRRQRVNSHQLEQDAFLAALRAGKVINNGDYMAKSTLMAIMTRMSAYTGQSLTWEQALDSRQDLSPSGYTWDSQPPEAQVAVPGVTEFV
ncbi:MAG: Gfo/Idh/MocA family oxidoreductase [Phycisphaerales bacterium]|nr:MAG: Gfo/Idh/MocA family oxidoreductase [Phycisphaerales bacterium]